MNNNPSKYLPLIPRKFIKLDICFDENDNLPKIASQKQNESINRSSRIQSVNSTIIESQDSKIDAQFSLYWNHMIAANKIIFPLEKHIEQINKLAELASKDTRKKFKSQKGLFNRTTMNETESFMKQTHNILNSLKSPREIYREVDEKRIELNDIVNLAKFPSKTKNHLAKVIKKLDLNQAIQREERRPPRALNQSTIRLSTDPKEKSPQNKTFSPVAQYSTNLGDTKYTTNKCSKILITNYESDSDCKSPNQTTMLMPSDSKINENDISKKVSNVFHGDRLNESVDKKNKEALKKPNDTNKTNLFRSFRTFYKDYSNTAKKFHPRGAKSSNIQISTSYLQPIRDNSFIELSDAYGDNNDHMLPYTCNHNFFGKVPKNESFRTDCECNINNIIMSKIIAINDDERRQTKKDLRIVDTLRNQLQADTEKLKKQERTQAEAHMVEHVDDVLDDIHKERLLHDTNNKWIQSPEFTHMAKRHGKKHMKQRLGVTKAVIKAEKKNLDRSLNNL